MKKNAKYNHLSYIIKSLSKFNLNTCKYLEIGVAKGNVFNIVPLPSMNKYGVDPNPNMAGNYRMTSDEFFQQNKAKFDVIFIDGLHSYEQCQRDCINSLKVINENGIIILHDFIPSDYIDEYVPRKTYNWSWTGDVWKVAVELSKSKNMKFCISNCDKGTGIVKPMKNYEYIKIPELKNLRFKDFYETFYKSLPIVDSEKAMKFID